MTIAVSEPGDVLDDAELAPLAARGDQVAFAAIYDRYADRLYDFCIGMLRDRDAAADCVQDVFVIAATKLDRLDDPDRLRGWLYAIARHEALERIRVRRRELPTEVLPEKASGEPDPASLVARNELADLIAEAFGGLPDRDRVVYELAYRHGLDGPELAKALGVSHTNANTLVGRLREGIERALGALLVCRSVRAEPSVCPDLALLVGNWDGTFTVLMRKRAVRHIDDCEVCDSRRRRMVTPAALLGGAPVVLPAPAWLRDATLHDATPALSSSASRRESERRHLRAGLGASLVLLGVAGVMALDVPVDVAPVEPARATVERPTPKQRFTIASTPVSSAGVITVAPASPGDPAPVTIEETPTLTSAPTRTSASRTTVTNSFAPSRSSTTRTRTRTSAETTERTPPGTMTATYLPGTPQTPTSPSSEPIE